MATAFVPCWPSAKSACRTGAAEVADAYGFCWMAERGCRDALGRWAASCGGKAGDWVCAAGVASDWGDCCGDGDCLLDDELEALPGSLNS